ncbi:uncharacterized protein LOC109863064 [Pseudomyrmex gracilis]|uniref:uncharacterized protein LOC109863064 n=1 Tax=Pseudomyrmex gracilis TaxID=219809 RepID=UPI000994D8C5|nr:uncharacterized protein LOC109863064 [Pseudomyrmex gracilis]
MYRIYIRSMTITNETSLYNYVNVQTPSTARFDDVLHDVPDEFSFTILLKVPHVLNDTYDSGMHIIVKGPNRCKNYSKIPQNLLRQVNVKKNDVGWQAAEITTDEIARNNYTFIVGDNKTYGGARNCPLQPNRSYEIIVILKEQRSIFRISNEMTMLKLWTSIGKVSDSSPIYEIWLSIPIILLLIIVVTVFYIYRRRTRQVLEQMMSQNEMEVWQNAEKTTVFSNTVKSR